MKRLLTVLLLCAAGCGADISAAREDAAPAEPKDRTAKTDASPKAGPVRAFTAGTPVEKAPEWAAAELAYLAKMKEAYETFLDKFFDGKLDIPKVRQITEHGGCDDDYAEGIAPWDRYLMLRGGERITKAYVHMWNSIFKERRMPGTNKIWCTGGFDPEHTSEMFQLLWGALELDPTNKKLIADNKHLADFIIDDFYDPKTRLLKSARILKLAGKYRNRGDIIQSTIYINSLILAYLTTGDEKYRKIAMEYGDSWNELAAANGGVFPFYVAPGGRKVGPNGNGEFWHAPFYDFDYDRWGLTISARAFHGWPLGLTFLDRGDARHVSGLKSTTLKMFQTRDDGLPTAYYKNGKWTRGRYSWCIPRMLDHAYIAHFDPKLKQMLKDYHAAARKNPKAGSEANFLRMMNFFYNGADDLSYPASIFRGGARRHEERIAKIRKAKSPKSGDELRTYPPSRWGLDFLDGAFWGQWDNGRCGAPSPSSIRYFRAGGANGLPDGVAALVRHVGKDSLTLLLYNGNAAEAELLLVAGTYGQHQWTSASFVEGERSLKTVQLDSRKVRVTLRPKSAVRIKLGIKRYANAPTLLPQRDEMNKETPK